MSTNDFQGMSVDVEGVSDSAPFSKLAIAALILFLVGALAPIEPALTVVSGAAAILALSSLLVANRSNFSSISRVLAAVVLFLASLVTVWSVVVYKVQHARQEARATEVALEYLQALGDGQMLTAIKMVGLDPVVRDQDETELSPAQKAVRVYLDDYAINQVIKRGKDQKWKVEGVIESQTERDPSGAILEIYRVRFYDAQQVNSRPFDVLVNFVPPPRGAANKTHRWMIDQLEIPSK